ncbi:MAG: cytochrome C oxidase subunit III [Sulfobacillus thermotolerans]|uniref:Cytochrome C oxidase subunit III n=1 Tax=Sulfobacillus thermotolerans TaxID=338644 RepID=A0ABM6RNM7_9FIRM|nr:cytochrome C oxidase subunit III [Sulfobacillus thermotolerans]MCY0907164.1 cytochrome C oxidase subunit III [Sulfobacillus thermotolerans]
MAVTYAKDREIAAYRWGFRIFLVSQSVPFILIFADWYMFDGYYVSPVASKWLGSIEAFFGLLSGLIAWQALQAIRAGHLMAMIQGFRRAAVIGGAQLVLLAYQWGTRFIPPGTRYGEVYYTLSGVSGFYELIGIFVLVAISFRAARVQFTAHYHWDAEAAEYFWIFQMVAGFLSYLFLYWI